MFIQKLGYTNEDIDIDGTIINGGYNENIISKKNETNRLYFKKSGNSAFFKNLDYEDLIIVSVLIFLLGNSSNNDIVLTFILIYLLFF